MSDYINELYVEGFLSELDVEFAKRVSDIYKIDDKTVKMLLALASRAATEGDVCVELDKLPKLKTEKAASYEWPEINTIKDMLNNSTLCSDGSEITPLVLDSNNRLYLYRYWNYQKRVVDNILERVRAKSLF
ncbi:MAG: hypothetical protein JXR91_02730, partial [Deltaproteobacteria bacterium]|nr:hypothetical protein [Deltaproteobacteria bacterium]